MYRGRFIEASDGVDESTHEDAHGTSGESAVSAAEGNIVWVWGNAMPNILHTGVILLRRG